MNISVAAILALVLLVVAVLVLVLWLVQRSRHSGSPNSAAAAPGEVQPTLAPRDVAAAVAAEAGPTSTPEPPREQDKPSQSEPESEVEPAPVIDLTDQVSDDEPIHEDGFWDDDDADDEESGTQSDAAVADAAAFDGPQEVGAQRSPLDDGDVDSTPLFRSIRDERLGAPSDEGAQDRSWSQERRDLDEQAHSPAEPVIDEGSAESVGAEPTSGSPRVSELHEVVDGGFGIGSAATIADGAQPLGHPIKANLDTYTYQDQNSPWYDETTPDVWFLDAGFAERAGFHRAE